MKVIGECLKVKGWCENMVCKSDVMGVKVKGWCMKVMWWCVKVKGCCKKVMERCVKVTM